MKSITTIRILYPILILINLSCVFFFLFSWGSMFNFCVAIFILILWIKCEKDNNDFYKKYGEYI